MRSLTRLVGGNVADNPGRVLSPGVGVVLGYALLLGVCPFVVFMVGWVLSPVMDAAAGTGWGFLVSVLVTGVALVAGVVPLLFLVAGRSGGVLGVVGIRKPSGGLWWLVGLGCGVGLNVAAAVVSVVAGGLFGEVHTNSTTSSIGVYPVWSTVVGSLVVAPVVEEFVFRGVMLGVLAHVVRDAPGRWRGVGVAAAAVVVSLLFAVIHVTPGMGVGSVVNLLVSIGAVSLVLCWVRLRFDSIVPCVLVHVVYNAPILVISLMTAH